MSYRQLPSSLSTGSARGEVQERTRGQVGEDFSFLISWRQPAIAALRIAFGCVWAVDAWLTWQPAFQDNLTDYLTKALYAQQQASIAWLNSALHVINLNPRLLAFTITAGETGIAIGLLLGALSNLTCLGGILLSLCLWSLASSSGYSYTLGASDSGISIVYVLVFVGLLLANAGSVFGVDRYLAGTLGHWRFLSRI